MADIIKEIISNLPEGKVDDAAFEGANIILYTKDTDYFLDNQGSIKKVVDMFKKRIELRPDPSVTMAQEKAEKRIKEILPEEALIHAVLFDPRRSQVVIEAEKPGLAIGKQGELLREIKKETFWVPLIRRNPAIKSTLIENIRGVLFENSEERRKFLDKTGHRIYDGWIRGKKNEWIRLTALGAGRQVGRSCFLLQTPESRIILDCGVDVANEQDAYPYLESPDFNIKELDAVIISHAHLDHSGFVPYLFKFGYRGPVYCTAPTRDVMALLQLDYIKIMRNDGREPIYTSDDVKEMVKHCITLDFDEVSDITPDVRMTFYNSGHILGSAMTHLHIGNGLHNFLYTADMKYARSNLLDKSITKFPRLESVLIESTYGGRDNIMPPLKDADDIFEEQIEKTVQRGGKILLPVLGSGRAQEMMIILHRMISTGRIKELPIYIDGMVWDITAIHTAYPEYLNSTVRKLIFHKDDNPFLAPFFKRIGSKKERLDVIEYAKPCIIMATSGMLTGGPSVEYLRYLGDDARNSLIFTCYQGAGSLGQRIRRGDKEILFKEGNKTEVVEIKLDISKNDVTAHSDRKELMSFIAHCDPQPKKVIINHGENSKCLDLASSMHKQFRIETTVPRNLETVRLK